MKKAFSLLLALCLLALPGCGGSKTAAESGPPPAATPASFASAEPADVEETLEEVSQAIEQGVSAVSGGSTVPAEAYAQYVEAKGKAFDRINAKLEENQELYLSLGMVIFPIAMIDISLIPLSFIGADGAAAMSILGAEGVKMEQSGNTYTLSFQDDQKRLVSLICEYDPATDSMRAESTQDGEELLFFEYARAGDGYASQYFVWDGDAKNYSWITSFFDSGDLAAFGITTVTQKQASIFQGGSGLHADFVHNKDSYFILEGGVLTVMQDGAVETY